ncbi:MAG: hypothetical protein H7326_07745 [Bdellovibrionaceae bacterium]|nr:hypothetical protein [Pseudobdellovibrionaceae bacterium]
MRKLTEFKAHIVLHRSRVVRLGLALAETKFPHIDRVALESFLKLHDFSKTLRSPTNLKVFGYENERAPLERLFDFYGRTSKTAEQNMQLYGVINDINSIDDQIAKIYLTPLSLDAQSLQSFYNIEKVADLVDRSLDPLAKEEFGHHMILASEFIQDTHLANLSMWLEERYSQITRDLSFHSYRKAE